MRVRIRFEKPSFFAADAKVRFALDGVEIYEGWMLSGVSHVVEVQAGDHVLVGRIGPGAFARKREWRIHVPESPGDDTTHVLDVLITYSRIWGGFEKDVLAQVVSVDDVSLSNTQALEPSVPMPTPVRPIATLVMLGLLVVGFVVELLLPVDGKFDGTPTPQTLVALGGLFPPSVHVDGEWYRFLTCTFLHGSFIHLLLNGVALFISGLIVEGRVGWRWFLAIYFVGAVGGSAMSLLMNDGQTVSVGASGAIMGLLTAGLFVTHTLPKEHRQQIQFGLLRMLIPSLIPVMPRSGERIDIGAHLGGTIACAAFGAVLYLLIRANEAKGGTIEEFRTRAFALVAAAVFGVASVASMGAVAAQAYPHARTEAIQFAAILSNDDLPVGPPDEASVATWLQQFPDDPRVLNWAANVAIDHEDWDRAEQHAAHGRTTAPHFSAVFPEATIANFIRMFDQISEDVALRRQMVPNSAWSIGDQANQNALWASHLDEWITQYPNDPRVRSKAAWRALANGNIDEAARHTAIDYAHAQEFARFFDGDLPAIHWLTLARIAVGQERHEDVSLLTHAICAGGEGAEVQEYASEHGLCADVPEMAQ